MFRDPRPPRASAAVVVALVCSSLMACGGDVAPPTTPRPTSPTRRLSTSPTALSCSVGQTVELAATFEPASTTATFAFAATNGNVRVATSTTAPVATANVSCLTVGSAGVTIAADAQSVTVPVTITARVQSNAIASWGTAQRSSPFGTLGDGADIHAAVRGLWGVSGSDVYAATSSGEIAHFDGTSWALAYTASRPYEAMAGSDPTDVFAVGLGIISRFDGSTWSDAADVPDVSLFGVYAAPGMAIAVGAGGTILTSTGGNAWTAAHADVATDLYGVWVRDSTAFVVGDSGVVLRRTGSATEGTWTRLEFPTTGTLVGVWGTSPTDVYVTDVTSYGIYHFDGTTFTQVASDVDVGPITGSSAADIVTGGLGSITQFDGVTWTSRLLSQESWVEALWAGGGVTMVGGPAGYTAIQRGTVRPFETLSMDPAWHAVWAASPTFAMAVGPGEQTMRWDGTRWTAAPIPSSEPLLAVWGTSESDVFAAGVDGNVFHYDGTAWGVNSPPSVFMGGLWGTASNNVFAVGDAIYRFDGTAWTTMELPSSVENQWLYGVSGSGPSNVVAVGNARVVLRFDGTSWKVLQEPQADGAFNAVWVADDSTAYLGSDDGTLYRLSGSTLTPLGKPSSCGSITGIWGSGATDVYLIDVCGGVSHFDGTQATLQSTFEGAALLGITGLATGGGGGWVVGDGALILRGTPPGSAPSIFAASRAARSRSPRAPLACAAQRPHARSRAPSRVPSRVPSHAGSVKRKVVPSPRRLSTTTWPPCASTMPRTIASPRPTPR
jgi:hypothetical protein